MTTEELPAWVQPGATVAVYWSQYGETKVLLQKVVRHTKTQIVLEDNQRFRKESRGMRAFERVGSSAMWSALCHLADPEDPKIKKIQRDTAIFQQAIVTRRSAENLLRANQLTLDSAQAVIDAATHLKSLLESEPTK